MSHEAGIKIPVVEPSPQPEMLCVDIAEAARRLSCSQGFVRKLLRRRKLMRLEDCRHILIPAASLESYVREASGFQD